MSKFDVDDGLDDLFIEWAPLEGHGEEEGEGEGGDEEEGEGEESDEEENDCNHIGKRGQIRANYKNEIDEDDKKEADDEVEEEEEADVGCERSASNRIKRPSLLQALCPELLCAIVRFIESDDLYYFAATCRVAYQSVTVSKRKLSTSWRSCCSNVARAKWGWANGIISQGRERSFCVEAVKRRQLSVVKWGWKKQLSCG